MLFARIRGEVILADRESEYLGVLHPHQKVRSHFRLTNITSDPQTIANVKTSCDCLRIMPEFPAQISPGNHLDLLVEYEVPEGSGTFQRHLDLWSESTMSTLIQLKLK